MSTPAADAHKAAAARVRPRCAVVTLSDTRTIDTDTSGQTIVRLLDADQCEVVDRVILKDDPDALRTHIEQLLNRADVNAILLNGGTGITRSDATVPVIESFLDIPLPGFGELFRMLSYEQVGSAAMLSRAVGGVARGKVLFAMPGSTKAVELAMTKLIVPELRHLLDQLSR